jgi:hypothetical protein
MVVNYNLGYYTVISLSLASAACVITRFSELLEWQSRYTQEGTASLNRANAREEAMNNNQAHLDLGNGKSFWIAHIKS